jgi:hypothetical protein
LTFVTKKAVARGDVCYWRRAAKAEQALSETANALGLKVSDKLLSVTGEVIASKTSDVWNWHL